jgi:MoaA/NifB/PqqE/SkfB family radical SAM enzyme
MDAAEKLMNFAAVKTAQAILRALPRISEDRLLSLPLVRSGLEAISKYPEGRDFFQSLLLQARRLSTVCSKACFQKFAQNLIINEFLLAGPRREAFHRRYGFDPPFLLVISPTMRCNLSCYGCYAGQYTKDQELSTETLHRILGEAKEMGIYFITLSGGEPFIRPDLLDLFATHGDLYFQVYTNGTFIDPSMAQRLSQLGNVLPAISIEGFEAETDARRGPGHFRRILSAMEHLRAEGVLFGFSATATRQNTELIVSDEWVDFFAQQGCFIGWYFNYIPIGKKPSMDLMPTPEQRIYRRRRLVELRKRTPMVLADFWNDGPLVGGCIAADRYLHINSRGDVEPCVFVHFAVDNIREKSLAEILDSPFFHAIRRRQPYSSNYYRPCMIIDHPHILREVVRQSGAHPTHEGADSVLYHLAPELDRYAQRYGHLADALWEEQHRPAPSSPSRTYSLHSGGKAQWI